MITEAQKRARDKYREKTYDRIACDFPRGDRERIKAAAAADGKSMQKFIVEAVHEKMGLPTEKEAEQ